VKKSLKVVWPIWMHFVVQAGGQAQRKDPAGRAHVRPYATLLRSTVISLDPRLAGWYITDWH